jgi:hypothetical protein
MLKERYQVPVGLSDHTPEIYSAIASLPFHRSQKKKREDSNEQHLMT